MRLLALVCALMLPAAASAQASRSNHIRVELVAQSLDPRAGSTVNLAIVFTPDPGWHGYWQNPGDAGQGATFDWSLPSGITAGAPLYPVPERLIVAGLMNHVYERQHTLIVPLRVPRGIAPGTPLAIRAKAQWLACTDQICVPEQGELAIDLKVGNGTITAAAQARFDGYWARLPRLLDQRASFALTGQTLRIGIPFPASAAATDAWFFASSEDAVAYAHPQRISRKGDLLIVETRAAGTPSSIEGVLALGDGRGLSIRAEPGAVPASADVGGGFGAGGTTALVAFLGAIAGGLLLNIMPCVFPIISLKALSLAKAGGDARAAKQDALAYTAGLVVACLALGGAMLLLRAAGQQVGWAFQLQRPAILFLLLLLTVAITLNLLGWFELRGFGGGQELVEKPGSAGAFWTGALAAFVATPCTGPFMAAALGAALVLPTATALTIFAGLGLGMALPFLAIGFVPALRRRLPKPGPWMARFRRILAVPMALTALALAWLLWRQGGLVTLAWAIVGVAGLALVIAILRQPGRRWAAAIASVAAILFAGQAWSIERLAERQANTMPLSGIRFDELALATARAKGPVFLYFTADWCLTCKVNEKAAIERAEVETAFARAGVTVMVGDWSKPDPVIGRFLESRGRSGIPLYLYYPVGKEAVELPQLLTPSTLTGLVS